MKKSKRDFIENIYTEDEYGNVQLTAEGCKYSSYVFGMIAVGSAIVSGTLFEGQEMILPMLFTTGSLAMSYVSYKGSKVEKVKTK